MQKNVFFVLSTPGKNYQEKTYHRCQEFGVTRYKDSNISPYICLTFYNLHKTKEVHTTPSVFIIANGNVHHTTLA